MQYMTFQRSLRFVSTLLCLFILAGCGTSGPRVRSNVAQDVDLTSFRTFMFMQPLSTDREGIQTIISRQLMNAAERELVGRGFQRVDSGADLMVNFSANLDQRLQVTQTPTHNMGRSMHSNAWGTHRRGFYNTWPAYRTDVRQYTSGTLVVDIVDAARRQLVWEGIAEQRITQRTANDAGPAIDAAISEIFARFPARIN
jgi:hypothetical protein